MNALQPKPSLIVQKYGGSSLQTPVHILQVARRIVETHQKGHSLVIVVSAMGRTTDDLVALAHQITDSPAERELDMLLSCGERISMALLSMALHKEGVKSISLTGSQSGIVTDTTHTKAKILEIKATRIQEALRQNLIVIVAGFQGVSTQKEITTLGRGGSDVTAVALAIHLKADRCEFYKDVDGIYSADPKKNKEAQKFGHCHYQDVLTMVEQGARVLHKDAVTMAKAVNLPLYLASSFHTQPGTEIHA